MNGAQRTKWKQETKVGKGQIIKGIGGQEKRLFLSKVKNQRKVSAEKNQEINLGIYLVDIRLDYISLNFRKKRL